MNTQAVLTVAAVIGPLVGVALGAFLASRREGGHWLRDHRLDAYAATQRAIYNLIASAPHENEFVDLPNRLAALTRFDDAVVEWQKARGHIALLAGRSLVSVADELHAAAQLGWAAKADDKAEWDRRWEATRTLRTRLIAEMRKELKT